MKHLRCVLAVIVLFSTQAFAQQVVVQTPNTEQGWKKGELIQIKWTCVGCSGTAEIHLVKDTALSRPGPGVEPALATRTARYQEIGVLPTRVAVDPGTPSYQVQWKVGEFVGGSAEPGGGYRILIKVVSPNATVSDTSDKAFIIGQAPQITSFAINDGATVTNQRQVTLNYVASGYPAPSRYQLKCSPRPAVLTQGPVSPSAPLLYELPAEPGDYTIELSVSNAYGTSQFMADSIRLYFSDLSATRQEYPALCGDVYEFAKNSGWKFTCTPDNWGLTSQCFMASSLGSLLLQTLGKPRDQFGAKADFVLFDGRVLNPGWVFKSLGLLITSCNGNGTHHTVETWPVAGTSSLLIRIHTSADAKSTCELSLGTLKLEGPAGKAWQDAFR